MGVRLAYFNKPYNYDKNSQMHEDHNDLINRDIPNQHPMYAITGLQEVLNAIENLLTDQQEEIDVIDETLTTHGEHLETIDQDVININERIDALKTVEDVIDTNTIDLDYDLKTKNLKADVKVYNKPDKTNLIKITQDGLLVNAYDFADTSTILWNYNDQEITLQTIWNTGHCFVHNINSTSDYYSSAYNKWAYSAARGIYYSASNGDVENYHSGWISQYGYDMFNMKARFSSDTTDDDAQTFVLYVTDTDGKPHTLSAMVSRGGVTSNILWALIYDYCLPTQQVLYTAGNTPSGNTQPTGSGTGNWSDYSNGIAIEISKEDNIVSICASAWDDASGTLEESNRITINLNSYSWGVLFRGCVRIGVGICGQGNTKVTDFSVTATGADGIRKESFYTAHVKISPDTYNSLRRRGNGLWNEEFRISSNANNALTSYNDSYGKTYFVQKVQPSTTIYNSLVWDGVGYLYCRAAKDYKEVTQTAHGFIVGDFLYYHPTYMKYIKAIAIDDYNINVVGMVSRVINSNTFEYMWSGFFPTQIFNTANGYHQGVPLYLSDTTAGGVTQKQPDISKSVGYPVEDAGIVISLERGIQYNNEAKIGDIKRSSNTFNVRTDGFIRITEGVQYKLTLVGKLTTDDNVSASFKQNYITVDNNLQSLSFKNVETLRNNMGAYEGIELFIKAF